MFQQGENARRQGRTSVARKFYFKYFTRNPYTQNAPSAMFRYALSNIPYKQSVAYLNIIIKNYPNYRDRIKVLDKLAMLHYLKDKFRRSIKTLDKIITARSVSRKMKLRAYYYIGKCYLILNKLTRSRFFFKKVVAAGASSYHSLSLLEIAETYFKQNYITKAKKLYEKIVTQYPESEAELKSVYRLGLIYLRLRDNQKSIAAFTYIIQTYPHSFEAAFAKNKLKSMNRTSSPIASRPIRENSSNEENVTTRRRNRREYRNTRRNNSRDTSSRNNRTLTRRRNRSKLTLHLGNYRNRQTARTLYRKLKRSGFKAILRKKRIGRKTYYVLSVGNYNSRRKAKKTAKKIIRQLRLRARIIERT